MHSFFASLQSRSSALGTFSTCDSFAFQLDTDEREMDHHKGAKTFLSTDAKKLKGEDKFEGMMKGLIK